MKKGFASALFITAAAAGAMAQSIGPEVGASEQFGILTLHSTAINVHLQTWSLNGQQVILSSGANLTMTLDQNGLIWDQKGDVCAVSKSDGSINFLAPSSVTSDYITGPWVSAAQGAMISLTGYTAYGCENSTAGAYQMYCYADSASAALPSCTNVALQPINGNGIISSLTTPSATSTSSSATSTSTVTSTSTSVVSSSSSSSASASASSKSTSTTIVTATSTASASTTTATSTPTTFTSGASAGKVILAGVLAIAGFAGLMLA